MDNILLSAALAFIITFFAIPIIIQIAKQKKLFDEPDERKVHKVVIPTLGGLGIFAGFILATLLGTPSGNPQLQYIAAAATVIFFLGLKDDILVLSAGKKFIGQLIAACIVIKFGGIQLKSMHGFLGIGEISHIAGLLFTLFIVIVITNSFNLIDGVDGLAGTLGLLTTIVLGSYFFYIDEIAPAVMAFSLTGSLVGFLIFNSSPAKIFMGDTGSLLIGLINSVLVIKFINLAGTSPKLHLEAAPAIGFAILIVPLFDTLRVFGLRIIARRSPFSPDRTHIHHFLLDLGFNHRKITSICVAANIGFITLALSVRHFGTTIAISILLVAGLLIMALIYYSRSKSSAASVSDTAPDEKVARSHKILSIVSEPVES